LHGSGKSIRLFISTSIRGLDELYETVNASLEGCAEKYGVPLDGETISGRFTRLLRNVSNKHNERVAVIIDEYDKPLLATIDAPETHIKIRNALNAFYGVLKSSDSYLRFVLLIGVTKFSQVSVFSDLNNLADISLNPDYYDLCGITQEELERDFSAEITQVCEEKSMDRQAYLAKAKRFYNGYRFSEKPETVYNPFGLLNHFYEQGKLVFRMLGLYCLSEVQTADGRIDCLVEAGQCLYCFEFKLNETAEAALAQIDRKDYLLPWQGSGKMLVKVG
jgi:hypothetical protein